MYKILLIEDELNLANLIKKGLEEDNYTVLIANDGQSGLNLLYSNQISLIIMDILLPKINGLELCKKIRSDGKKEVPILMLTALNSPENVVLGLDSGADDYLAKPFKLIELKARIRTLLRRAPSWENNLAQNEEIFRFSDLELNDYTKILKRNGKQISLTSTEYRLMKMFLNHPKKVLSRTDLLDVVWGINFDLGTNVVDVYVNYLRKKLDTAGSKKLIHTVIGQGYVLKENENTE